MNVRSYVLVTLAYWAFTVTDGALRLLVLLYFHDLGYNPVSLALLFMLYELFGVFTNLVGGWLGARSGLRVTLIAGLALQVVALMLLSLHQPSWREWLAVGWVMLAQALSGIAKDLTKVSSKTAVKYVAGEGRLFRLVAVLTGSKNALKGAGFFVGAALLNRIGFSSALVAMAIGIAVVLVIVLVLLRDLGQPQSEPPLGRVLTASPAITRLSVARFFLFGSRDIWFVVALPVFLDEELGWSFEAIGAFLAFWLIGYGFVQALAPKLLGARRHSPRGSFRLLPLMALMVGFIAAAVWVNELKALFTVGGLFAFGAMFAVTSSVHSYLILAYSQKDSDTAMDVGYYYSANAAGRMVGTLLSGVLFLVGGFTLALGGTILFLVMALVVSVRLPPVPSLTSREEVHDVAVS